MAKAKAKLTRKERKRHRALDRAAVEAQTNPKVTAIQGGKRGLAQPSPEAVLWSKRKGVALHEASEVFTIPRPPKGVVPQAAEKGVFLAMDSQSQEISVWAAGTYASGWFDGPLFIGYPALALFAALPEYRRMAEVLATECTRKWIRLGAVDSDDKSKLDRINQLNTELERIDIRGAFRRLIELDAFFGRAHLFIDVGTDPDNRDELQQSIGNGRNDTSKVKFQGRTGFLRGVKPIEPVWCYPAAYNATNPLKDDWYAPQIWYCQSQSVHVSRLMRFVGREMPDLLKPAYMFGGVSLSQLMKPYVDRWITVVQSVTDIIVSYSTSGIRTNLETLLKPTGGGMSLPERAELFANLRSNQGLMLLDKDTEEFFQFNTPLSELESLVSKFQEFLSSMSGEPVVKLLGIQPAGLNACLPGDTLILTKRGEIPIRDVTTSDEVMTRKGWAPLTFAGITKHATELFEIRTASTILQCTANHPIWVASTNAFVPAENVRRGDRLLLRTGAKSAAQNTHRRSHGTASGGGSARTDIIPLGMRNLSGTFSFIGRCGKRIVGQSRTDFTSIISTKIKRIISFPILSPSTQKFTPNVTTSIFERGPEPLLGSSFALNAGRNSSSQNSQAGKGFVRAPAYSPTDDQPGYRPQNHIRFAFAACVENLSARSERTLSFARAAARRLAKTAPNTSAYILSLIRKNSSGQPARLDVQKSGRAPRNAPIAGWISYQLAPLQSFIARSIAKIAQRNCDVLSIRKIRADEPVYDLTVAEGYLPEFFANGILTHNSSEGEITSWLDWVEAFREKFCAEHLTTIIDFAQLSLFGEVDPDIVWTWESLRSLDPQEETERRKVMAETDAVYSEIGVFDPSEIRARELADPESPYYGMDELTPDEAAGPEGAGLIDTEVAGEFPQLEPPAPGPGEEPPVGRLGGIKIDPQDETGQEDPRTARRGAGPRQDGADRPERPNAAETRTERPEARARPQREGRKRESTE